MAECQVLIDRFTLAGQDRNIRELSHDEEMAYNSIYSDLAAKHLASNCEIPQNSDIQVISKIFTVNGSNVTPMGLVNVSLEYLAKILTFAKAQGIQWQAECTKCTGTQFKGLSRFTVNVDCQEDEFKAMAQNAGFRY